MHVFSIVTNRNRQTHNTRCVILPGRLCDDAQVRLGMAGLEASRWRDGKGSSFGEQEISHLSSTHPFLWLTHPLQPPADF